MPVFHFFSNCWCYLLNSGPQINIDTGTKTKAFCFDHKTRFDYNQHFLVDFSTAQMAKNLPAMQEIWVQSRGQEDLLEKEMASHSSILAWKIPWMEGPGRLQSMGSQRVRHNWVTSLSLFWVLAWELWSRKSSLVRKHQGASKSIQTTTCSRVDTGPR